MAISYISRDLFMKTVLLTGATGFVGRQIAKWVAKAGVQLDSSS